MFKVPEGKDPYSEIGKYIQDHIPAIEDMIAVIEIDGVISNELFLVNMREDNYFVWKSDWWEGEQNIALIDFFPVSDAQKSSVGKARWITQVENYVEQTWCSKCGKNAPFVFVADDHYGNHAHGETVKTRFCPNCGKRMEDSI